MRRRIEQDLVLVLAMKIHKGSGRVPQRRAGDQCAVDERPAASL
jgi:hypothetical protein